ncbi:hypothetical protein ACQP2P_27445 [Dactylosporangium sp. CA-139114]|uniref:hypothetical protein n=1 Tax=Dactylosporangium sp. CA-139114 TaxID=3239931 RepID=UPI003D9769B4
MTDALSELTALVGAPPRPGPPIPEAALRSAFGTAVPEDYVRYVGAVPAGTYQTFLTVLQPAADGSTEELRAAVALHRRLIADDGGPGPDQTDLVPWAAIQSDAIVCWVALGEPADWPVAVFDRYGPAVHEFPGGCVAFLLAFVRGETGIEALAYIHEDQPRPRFDPDPGWAAADPPGPSRPEEPLAAPIDAGRQLLAAAGVGPGAPRTTDWAAVQAGLGRPVPGDYRRLIDAGCGSRIGPVLLTMPGDGPESSDPAPADPGLDRLGLVPFGRLDGGAVVGWSPVGPDPERWPVTVASADRRVRATHQLSATAFLLRLVEGVPLYLPD